MNESTLRSLLNLDAEKTIDSMQFFDEIDSTNSEALRQLRLDCSENRLFVAATQTAGRGRRGREWHSPKDSGIYFSLTRSFEASADALQGLSLVTALAVVEAMQELGAEGLQLKWPNDVLHEKKKVSGILLELQQKSDSLHVVFGVGVNRSLSEESISSIDRPVTDLAHVLPELPSESILLAALLNRLCQNVSSYEEHGFAPFEQSWNAVDCYRMTDVVIQNGESRMIGKSLGVNADGALLLQTASGIHKINGGEVFPSLRPLSDATRMT